MKNGWEVKRLGDVCTLQRGFDLPTHSRFSGIHPLVSSNGITDWINEWKVKGPGVITGRSGSIGNIHFVEENFWPLNTALYIKDFHGNYPRYVYYLLRQFDLGRFSSGAGVPTLNRNHVHDELVLTSSSLAEQQRIVAILDEAFAAIAKAKANAEQNLKNAKELFESYLQGVFEQRGEGWEDKTLNQISENLDSKRVPITKNVRSEGSIPYYGASGVVDYVGEYLFDENLLCVSEDGANLLARTYPIAFSIAGKTWVNNHAHVLRFSDFTTQVFVERYLNSIKLDDYVSGMAQPKLNQAMLNKIPIPVPPIKEQRSIVQKLDALSAETKRLESIYRQKIVSLDELKKTLLQKAFQGELRSEKITVKI